MISYLNIKNVAIISSLELELFDGLNILSGETGAGKSIVIDSINFVLGDRADRSLIRYGESTASVEVVFDKVKNFSEIQKILIDSGIDCDDNQIIVTRSMTSDKSECRINRKIVPLSLLRSVVSLLVDTHTQNEHQTLLKTSNQIRILDGFLPNLNDIKKKYNESLARYKSICEEINAYSDKQQREREIDMLSYQIEEIDKAALREGEEEELKAKRSTYYNRQKIVSSLKTSYEALSGESGFGATRLVGDAMSELKRISEYDPDLIDLSDRLDACRIELSDIEETVYDKLNNGDMENVNIDVLEKRLEEIRLISKKYGKTIEDINDYYQKATEKLDRLLNAESQLNKLEKKAEESMLELMALAEKLHEKRIEASKKLSKAIKQNIADLGMKNAVFEIRIDKFTDDCRKYTENGFDQIEFMLSPNIGEPVKPLAKIASGGEISRFMLALKNVIAEIDDVDTLIFDEIDTGISGVIARVVAEKMYNISRSRQVIAITHLPQLGSMADENYLIEKRVVSGKTMTFVDHLEADGVIRELMRLSGAVENSEVGRNNAIELKEKANQFKLSLNNQ